jgi:glycosyltransferase involved in cell wall biosynthesis
MNENGKSLLNPDAAIVIPVYNEAEVLLDVLSDVLGTFENVICVDDGCTELARHC